MDIIAAGGLRGEEIFFLLVTVAVAAGVSLTIFAACYLWFRRQQSQLQKKKFNDLVGNEHNPDCFFLTGRDAALHGELVAQFKVNRGKQVVSLLESDGKRFLHVEGKLSAPERAKMVRYLKSEGFMS
ncbi:MAG: hypothetical protein LV481_13130 [Methylacidiphilales bacterium]|nr:hypothetical protein [Candidatus Methylacidiphilales bacterium]